MVIRSTRSFTRSSTGSEAFLYGRHSVSDLAKDFVAGMLITLAIAVVANRNVVKTFCFLPDRFRLAMFIAKVCNNVDRSCESPSSRSHDDYLYFLLRSSHRNEVAMAQAAPEKDPSLSHEAITQTYAPTATCMTPSEIELPKLTLRNRGGEAKKLKCGERAKFPGDASIIHRPMFCRRIVIGRSGE